MSGPGPLCALNPRPAQGWAQAYWQSHAGPVPTSAVPHPGGRCAWVGGQEGPCRPCGRGREDGVGAHAFHATVSQLQTQAAEQKEGPRRATRPCGLSGETGAHPGSPWLLSQQGLLGTSLRQLWRGCQAVHRVWARSREEGAPAPWLPVTCAARVSSQPPSSNHGDMRI